MALPIAISFACVLFPRECGSLWGRNLEVFLQTNGAKQLKRDAATTLQLNIGLYCNQACSHCHVESSPKRQEMMDRATAERCLQLLRDPKSTITTVDLTGGAPEMNSEFRYLSLLLPGPVESSACDAPTRPLTSFHGMYVCRCTDMCIQGHVCLFMPCHGSVHGMNVRVGCADFWWRGLAALAWKLSTAAISLSCWSRVRRAWPIFWRAIRRETSGPHHTVFKFLF